MFIVFFCYLQWRCHLNINEESNGTVGNVIPTSVTVGNAGSKIKQQTCHFSAIFTVLHLFISI